MEENKFTDLMVDIETMGNQSFSSIISIAALEFNLETGKTGKEFHMNISLESNMELGLNPNPDTIMWWLQQNEQARIDLATSFKVTINEALMKFRDFCSKEYNVWGNSARFDLGLLQNAYNRLLINIPWDFRKERCVRTLVSFAPDIKVNYSYTGTAHNALADCYNQVGYCSTIWNSLNRK